MLRLNPCLLLFVLSSCAHNTESRFKSSLTEGSCEEALKSIPSFKVKEVTEYGLTTSGAPGTYALTGAAYGYNLIYFVVGGIAIPTLACMPAFPFTGSSALYEKCFEKLYRTSELGFQSFDKIQKWSCPDLGFAVDQLLNVAQCYQKRGDGKKAREQRELLLDDNAFGGCVSEGYKIKISQLIEQGN